MRFAIGGLIVDVVVDDDDFQLPLEQFLPGIDTSCLGRHRDVLEPDFLDLARQIVRFAVQTFVIRVDQRTLLVDTCIGEHKDRPEIPAWHQRHNTSFLEQLAKCGIQPESVDIVFCTHLHVDHVGWNTRGTNGQWAPTFPNARYLFGRAELADWMARRDAGMAPALHALALQDSVLPIVESGLVDLVDDGYEIAKGLVLTRLPGHTAGQMGLQVDRQNDRAIFCGDTLHSPAQIFEPDISTSTCVNAQEAAVTRRALLEDAADTGRLLVPAHFRGARCARIRRSAAEFEPVFNAPD
jgi:glyoxylase-like metal-dependent hydrolase (beta-lactamase superfamily II)